MTPPSVTLSIRVPNTTGWHSFNSVLLTNGAVLTHSPCTATETHKLELLVTDEIVISTNSRIDVSGNGYARGYTTGNTTNGAATQAAGGSYGGLGGWNNTPPNATYGDFADPDDWGSGGGPLSSASSKGGGLMRLTVGTLQLDGQLLANGVSAHGAGSGGGIYVTANTLAGTGVIQARGGNADSTSGAGGGGRIAIYAADYSAFGVSNITASGGSANGSGAAGTIYLRRPQEPYGTLLIRNVFLSGSWTPLGHAGTNYTAITELVVIEGPALVGPEHAGMVLEFANTMTMTNGARLELENLRLSGATPLVIGANSLIQLSGALTSTAPVTVNGGTLRMDRLVTPQLTLTNGALLTCLDSTANQMHKLDIEIAGTLTVSADSRIDVSGKGYGRGYTTGNTTNGAATQAAGGSYGGLGGYNNTPPNAVYGDYADPDDWGSGGGPLSSANTAGGGLVRLSAGVFQLDGQLLANGVSAHGAGSGGGIYISVGTLGGSGAIQARGGNSNQNSGAGGGGRIALYAMDYTGFALNNISASGGSGNGSGLVGTVHIVLGRSHTHARSTVPGRTVVFPSQSYTDYINELLPNGLAIHFNKPIATNSFSPDKFSIHGPLGAIVPTGISEIGDRLYRFAFAPQTANGAYHFTLLPTLLDTEGFMFDQNANGIPGETNDAFSFTLILDTVPPRITQHTPNGDIAGTVTNVDIWFSETIDTSTFSIADIGIRNPTNGTVAVTAITNVGLNRFRVRFPAQTLVGQYHVIIGTNITDLAGNTLSPLLGEGVAYDASFNLVPVDLELTNATPSTNHLWAGAAVSVAWQGRNNSGAPLLGNWIDAVYLSPDPFWNITDIFLGTVQHTGGLLSNEVYSASLNFNVPGLVPGNHYLIVRADLGNQTRETVETNNVVAYGPLPVSVRQMSIGGSLAGTLTPGNRHHYFAINVPSGESLRLTLDGQNGVNHLFVNHASIPTRLNSDVSGTGANSDQTITLTGVPGGGTYYVLVSGEQVGGNGNYTLTADSASFFLSDFTPRQLVGGFSQRFWVQILQSNLPSATLTGVGFDEATTVEFLGTNGSALLPLRKEFVSPSMLQLVLPVEYWPH